jgi:hypothetical protein
MLPTTGSKIDIAHPSSFLQGKFSYLSKSGEKMGGGGGGVGVPNIPILLIHSRSHWACQPHYMLATVIQIRVV